MLFLLLFLGFFFTPCIYSLSCLGGSSCNTTISFNQKIPSIRQLPGTCSIINASLSCNAYLKMKYNEQKVEIYFNEIPEDLPSALFNSDPLKINRNASIILRYAVKVLIDVKINIELHALLQCRTADQCTDRHLRHFWQRFTAFDQRQNMYRPFSELLFSNTSNFTRCFNGTSNQSEQCDFDENVCRASTNNTNQQCDERSEDEDIGFIYAYNKVDLPHRLTTEDVQYVLTCRVDDCNDNRTIRQLSGLARQFAENSWPMNNNSRTRSLANKLRISSLDIFCLGLLFLLK